MGIFEFLEQQQSVSNEVRLYREDRERNNMQTERRELVRSLGILAGEATAGLVGVAAAAPNTLSQASIMAGTAATLVASGVVIEQRYKNRGL